MRCSSAGGAFDVTTPLASITAATGGTVGLAIQTAMTAAFGGTTKTVSAVRLATPANTFTFDITFTGYVGNIQPIAVGTSQLTNGPGLMVTTAVTKLVQGNQAITGSFTLVSYELCLLSLFRLRAIAQTLLCCDLVSAGLSGS